MPFFHTILIQQNEPDAGLKDFPFLAGEKIFFVMENKEDKEIENIVYRLIRNPKNLMLHLQRIYVCYQQKKSEQLYAALVDLLTLLAGKGRSLAWRMIKGTASGINSDHLQLLQRYFKDHSPDRLPVNRYTVLSDDLVGKKAVVEKLNSAERKHDYLKLAHDYIEYSQLDSAIDILEQGIEEDPVRDDIQEQLLELYQVTENKERFSLMYSSLLQNQRELIPGWKALEHYFDGQKK